MCGRTSLYVDPAIVEARFDATFEFAYESRYNIAPRQDLATVRNADDDHIVAQEWGLLAPWADSPDDGPRPINARSETVADTPLFRDAFAERRCLVIADGFYEWAGDRASKQPYRIHLAEDRPFAMAGLWNRWQGDQRTLETVTICTTDANDVVEGIHDRMPVVLEPDTESDWLHGDGETALAACRPYPRTDMDAYPISTAVNDPANDRPEIVRPAETEQRGLEDFGG